MARARLPMRKIRDVLRLTAEGMSSRKIAASLSIGATTVVDCLHRARTAGVGWPLSEDITDEALEARLFPDSTALTQAKARRPMPEWALIHRELKRPGVTLLLLWEEYHGRHPDGLRYSRFCEIYQEWKRRLTPTMRQTHIAGERMFVDYSGKKPRLINPTTGEPIPVELFVAVLGASNLTFAEATWTQSLADWTGSHTRAFEYFGGVTELTVSDNLKSGITKACFYEAQVNRTYRDMARHYGTTVLPARPKKPKDKAKVEVGVQVVGRWVLAKLRNRTFFSLSELNDTIRELLTQLNERVTRHLGASRRALFEQIERAALKRLPAEAYVFSQWKECRVGIDYHVEVKPYFYSVSYTLLREKTWVRYTESTVEVFHRDNRVAVHPRVPPNGRKYSTLLEHMPSSHRRFADWTLESIKRQAGEVGPNTSALVDIILRERPHPEQGFRSCIGIIRLAKMYGRQRLDAACERALDIRTRSYRSVKSILQNSLDRKRPEKAADEPAIVHSNIRGRDYYH
jgi:transposase